LIIKFKGKIVNADLSALLTQASAHFDVIIMAYEHTISGDSARFSDFVYPRELQKKIEDQIKKMTERLSFLEKK